MYNKLLSMPQSVTTESVECSHIWLGTISEPYGSPMYWVAGFDEDSVKRDLVEQHENLCGETNGEYVWNESSETYCWLKDTRDTVEARRVNIVD